MFDRIRVISLNSEPMNDLFDKRMKHLLGYTHFFVYTDGWFLPKVIQIPRRNRRLKLYSIEIHIANIEKNFTRLTELF